MGHGGSIGSSGTGDGGAADVDDAGGERRPGVGEADHEGVGAASTVDNTKRHRAARIEELAQLVESGAYAPDSVSIARARIDWHVTGGGGDGE